MEIFWYFFIFGWGRTTFKDKGETLPTKCGHCGNSVYYHLLNVKRWFTLFFIPIFPYESKNYLSCPICETGVELTYEGNDLAEEFNEITFDFIDKKIKSKDYEKKLKTYSKKIFKEIEDE